MTLDPNTPLPLLGGRSPHDFLQEFWQKKPLLIRQAIPHFESPIDGNDLAGLSLEEEIESRLILEHGSHPWELLQGPFDEAVFERLPKTHWTLLIQSVDVWLPEVAELRESFRFLPDWRIEDIMVSYATPEGGVGPHFDQYDVFLLQGAGKRRWRLGNKRCSGAEARVPDTSLCILQDPTPIFENGEEWVLEPGDMLYIPPQWAHWGTAESDECITYSIGFRAPSQREILSGCSESASHTLSENTRFKDATMAKRQNSGEILTADIEQLKHLLRQSVEEICQDDAALAQWFGKEMTYPRVEDSLVHADNDQDNISLNDVLSQQALQRSPNARFAYFSGTSSPFNGQSTLQQTVEGTNPESVMLFANGEHYRCSQGLAVQLCAQMHYAANTLSVQESELDRKTLTSLISQGWLEPLSDES